MKVKANKNLYLHIVDNLESKKTDKIVFTRNKEYEVIDTAYDEDDNYVVVLDDRGVEHTIGGDYLSNNFEIIDEVIDVTNV